jgi:predicted PurR-regulated permease PerM
LEALVFMIALQQLEGHILVPNIMRSQTDISPVLSIVALLAGAEIGGLLGVAVALPIAAALTVLVREVIAPAIRKQTGAAEPTRPS